MCGSFYRAAAAPPAEEDNDDEMANFSRAFSIALVFQIEGAAPPEHASYFLYEKEGEGRQRERNKESESPSSIHPSIRRSEVQFAFLKWRKIVKWILLLSSGFGLRREAPQKK